MSDPDQEFDQLLQALATGSLSEAQRAQLEKRIREDAEARAKYLDYMAVDAMLRFRAGVNVVVEAPGPGPSPRSRGWVKVAVAIAACVAVGIFVIAKLINGPPTGSLSSPRRQQNGSRWAAGISARRPGANFKSPSPRPSN